jgi:hypothetical protein
MKTLLSTVALAGALLLTGMAPLPASAQSSAVPLDFNGKSPNVYSWGVIYPSNDGPQLALTWGELNRRANPATASVSGSAQSAGGAGEAVDRQARIEQLFGGRSYNTYSWGVMSSPNDGPQISYTWADLDRRAKATAALN